MSQAIRESTWDRHGVIAGMLKDVPLPRMARVRQVFDDAHVADLPAAVGGQVAKPEIRGRIKRGAKIAVTVGSRGLAHLPELVRSLVASLKQAGAEPFVVPAMGSHGGGTAEGQVEMLAGLGVTEASVGAPIRSSMETVIIGKTPQGNSVHLDRIASQADGIVVFGRVKPHTCFRGRWESGLLKMMAIGLGKHTGASEVHAQGFGRMAVNVPAYARVTLATGKVVFGLAVVENAFDDTCRVEAIEPENIVEREAVLQEESKRLMPHIKFDPIDVLVCDQLGKNFSGDGMDPNITASYITPYASGGPKVERYVVLDVSDESHGNSLGSGVADFTTKRLFDKTDFDSAYPNALTARVVAGAKMPMVLTTDRLAMQAALYTVTEGDRAHARIVRIPNTSHVSEIEISEALLDEARAKSDVEILEGPREWPFDKNGNLLPV